MEQYAISWSESGEERLERGFSDTERATAAARERANLVQHPVRVLRPDGSTVLTVRPEAPTVVSLRRPRG